MPQNSRRFQNKKLNLTINPNHLKHYYHHIIYSILACIIITRIYLPNFELYNQIKKKSCYKTCKVSWNFSKISSSQNYPYSLTFLQRYYYHPIYSPSFHHLLRLIILLLSRKVIGMSFQKFKSKIMFRKKIPKWYEFAPLKRRRKKEVKENPTRWPTKGSNAWWPMKGSNV